MTGAAWRDGTRLIVRSRVVDDAFSRPPGAYTRRHHTAPRTCLQNLFARWLRAAVLSDLWR